MENERGEKWKVSAKEKEGLCAVTTQSQGKTGRLTAIKKTRTTGSKKSSRTHPKPRRRSR